MAICLWECVNENKCRLKRGSDGIGSTFFLFAYQPNSEQGEGYGGQCAGEEGRDAVELAGKPEEPSGKVEQQSETDAAEEF